SEAISEESSIWTSATQSAWSAFIADRDPGLVSAAHGQARLIPAGTEMTPVNALPEGTLRPRTPLARGRSCLPARRGCPRACRKFTPFPEYTDAQLRRIIDYLDQ